ncbi:hypothetical protein GQ42DRAFT_68449, partial [Ramicandelaber brevisporus]
RDTPIHPTQVVKHRDELEHAFELQRLCFQASQPILDKLSDARQRHSHSQRAEGQPVHLPELEQTLAFRGMKSSDYHYLSNLIRLALTQNNSKPCASLPRPITGVSPGIQHLPHQPSPSASAAAQPATEAPTATATSASTSTPATISSSTPTSSTSTVTSASVPPPPSSLNSQSTSMSTSTPAAAAAAAATATEAPQLPLDPSEIQLDRNVCVSILVGSDMFGGLQDDYSTKSENDIVIQLAYPLKGMFNTVDAAERDISIRVSSEKSYTQPNGVLLRADIMVSNHLHSKRVACSIEVKKNTANARDKLRDVQKSIRFAVNQTHTAISQAYDQAGEDLARVAKLLKQEDESLASYSMTIVEMDHANTVQGTALPLCSLGEVMVVYDPQYRVVARKELKAVVSDAMLASGFSRISLAASASADIAATRYKLCTVRAVNTLFMLAYVPDAGFIRHSMLESEKFFNGLKPAAQLSPLEQPAAIQREAPLAFRRSERIAGLNQEHRQRLFTK